jgi:hypothetical protein
VVKLLRETCENLKLPSQCFALGLCPEQFPQGIAVKKKEAEEVEEVDDVGGDAGTAAFGGHACHSAG